MNGLQKLVASIFGIETKGMDFLPADQNQLFRQLYQYIGQAQPIAPETDGEKFITQGYHYNHLVYSIVSFLARKASTVDYKAFRYSKGGKKEELEEHDILNLIYHPNGYQGKSEFLEQFHGFKLLTGNTYVYTPKLGIGLNAGKATEMHVMPAYLMEIVSGSMFEPIGGYKLRWGNNMVPFDPEEVMHSKYQNYWYNNGSELYGLSPIQAAWQILAKSNSNNAAAKSSFDNKGAQGIVFDKSEISSGGTLGQLTEEQLQKMQARWDRKVRGASNMNRILFTSADLGYIDLGASPVDLALLEDSRASKVDLCNIFHVPSVLFDNENSTYNNLSEARKVAWTDAILPECYSFTDEFNRHFRDYKENGQRIYVEPDKGNIEELQADLGEMAAWLKDAYWLKGSEKREMMGLENDPEMDKYFVPMGLIPSDELGIDQSAFEKSEQEKLDYFRENS